MAERERHQLVVALGEGDKGEAYRRAIDEAAARAGMKVVPWARRMLLRAASVVETAEGLPTREDFEDLRRRVVELEARTLAITSHRASWLGCSPDCGSHRGYACDCGYERWG